MTTQPEALRTERVNYLALLRTKLKSGEYDGVDIMDACLAIDELRRLHEQVEALRADAERLDWCISVLFGGGWLTTDVGCGCCGDGKSFDSDITGRAAIDAVRGKA